MVMKKFSKYGILVSLALAAAPSVNAGVIEGQLFNTGLNGSGSLISGIEEDANWFTVDPEGGAVAYNHPSYALSNAGSQWISIATDGASNDLNHRQTIFATRFDLTGYDASTAAISGIWGVDNAATIFLNGVDTGEFIELNDDRESFTTLRGFNINDYFTSGVNLLTIDITNGYTDVNRTNIGPLALRFDDMLLTATRVPEPGTLALVALGLVGLGLSRRRKV